MKRLLPVGFAVVFLSAAAASLETRLMWGYWVNRPPPISSSLNLDAVVAVSAFRDDWVTSPAEAEAQVSDATAACAPVSNECLEGRLLVGGAAHVRPADDAAIEHAWTLEKQESPLPRPDADGAPFRNGLGLRVRSGHDEYVILGYRSPVSDDRHLYSEAVYRIRDEMPERIRTLRFAYEVAGLEDLTWSKWLVLDLIVFGSFGIVASWWLTRRRRSETGRS